jgi:hypothetical protein
VHGVARWQSCEGEQWGRGVKLKELREAVKVIADENAPRGVVYSMSQAQYQQQVIEAQAQLEADATRWWNQIASDVAQQMYSMQVGALYGAQYAQKTLGGSAGSDGARDVRTVVPEQPAEPRPVCACGQTIWKEQVIARTCGDCMAEWHATERLPLDTRIAAAKVEPVTTRGAWDWDARDAEYEL